MADILEGTPEFNRGHQLQTGEIPVTHTDSVVDMFTPAYTKDGFPVNGAAMDPFDDDTPLSATCDTENPDICESCT